MSGQDNYFEYLQNRSRVGLIYRRYWLYPRLSQYLDGRVLDVGCGIGDMLNFRPGTVGVDINTKTVEWCQRQGLPAYVMQPDLLPFPDEEYDGVILDNVLEHLMNPNPLLNEIRRVLKKGGRLIVGVPGRRGYASDPDHKKFYDRDALRNILSSAGFACKHIFSMPLPWCWLDSYLSQYCNYGIFLRND